jgi:hypothetical protein
MGRIKRGGYIIDSWIGDHLPKHVHIYKNGRLVAKVEIPSFLVLEGSVNRQLKTILASLRKDGLL